MLTLLKTSALSKLPQSLLTNGLQTGGFDSMTPREASDIRTQLMRDRSLMRSLYRRYPRLLLPFEEYFAEAIEEAEEAVRQEMSTQYRMEKVA